MSDRTGGHQDFRRTSGYYAQLTCSIKVKDDKLFPWTRLMKTGLSARASATVHTIGILAPFIVDDESVTVSPASGDVTVKSFCA